MSRELEYPKLRWPIDIRMEKVEQGEVLLLSCPHGVSPAPLALVPAVAPILGCFEGQLSVEQICLKFQQAGIQRRLVEELVRMLDEHLFLATGRYFAAERAVRDAFATSSCRAPALAGSGYSADGESLTKQVDRFLEHADRPPAAAPIAGELHALIAPHIDYRRGSIAYALTYRHLRNQRHTHYILLGTAHQYSKRIFHLTAKDFETPLGILRNDAEFVNSLAKRYGVDRSFEDEFLHRREHSLELQTPFLARLRAEAQIVPILVGSFHYMLGGAKLPEDFEEYETFAAALAQSVRDRRSSGARVCFVAGVDLAHIGRNFGDPGALSAGRLSEVERKDRELLAAVAAHDKKGLFRHISEDGDSRRICGFPALYTLLDVMERSGMRYDAAVYDYRQAVDYGSDCAVTFAGAGLYQR